MSHNRRGPATLNTTTHTAVVLTADERDLLSEGAIIGLIGRVVTAHLAGVNHIRNLHSTGRSAGFVYDTKHERITGRWRHYHVVERYGPIPGRPDLEGKPARTNTGDYYREVSITFTRLQQWAEQLPTDLVDRAITAWAISTRDLDELDRITVEAINLGVQPTQLDLFEGAS